MGVQWFVSRRGAPAADWSDNGTKFVSAEKIYARTLKSRTPSTLTLNSLTKALKGGSTRPVNHTNVASVRS